MKVADYVLDRIADEGVDRVFLVYGAALGELVDALTRTERIKHVCPMHEQGGGFMAEGYAKAKGGIGFAMATSGPGAGNLITCIQNAYYDSVPMIFVTGQVTTKFQRPHEGIRQLGFQETDVVGIVKPITKYAVMVRDPKRIRYEMEKAIHLCKSGRPGPVLLDLPIDIQKATCDPANSEGFSAYEMLPFHQWFLRDFANDLEAAKRPGILVGGGAYKARDSIIEFATRHNIPCFPTWNALDIITSDLPIYGGRIGTYGGPGRNFGIQNCDLVLSLGCRLSGRITGGMPETFVRGAKLYVVDVDEHLLEPKYQPRKADVNILCRAKDFMRALLKHEADCDFSEWNEKVTGWVEKYDNVKPAMLKGSFHHYGFLRKLSEDMPDNAIIVSDTGGNVIMMAHAFKSKRGQRLFTNNGNTPMGFAFAAAIGAWFAEPKRPIVCIIGDGGFNMNIQEIQTLVNYGAVVKTFIIDNSIYGNTASYQKINYEGRCLASGPEGYKPPNFIAIAGAYGIKALLLNSWERYDYVVSQTLYSDESVICDVVHDQFCTYEPRISRFDLPIEDMYPFLPRDEFRANMITEPLKGWEGVK